ncbi:hypothetical protein D9M70_479530 [compost metagenome]
MRTGRSCEGQCAESAGRDKYKQMKMAPPMGRAGMHQEPGHTWAGSALTGQRLQEPALLGVPMYEAHRSWQLPGQCRAAIIMYAARNRIRLSPILFAAWAGPSLRRAVTAHLMAFEPRATGKGLRQARTYLLPTTLTRPMALSATCAGVAW